MCITLDNRSNKFNKSAIKNDELRSFANMLAEDAMNIRANLLHMSAIMATIASKRDSGILEEFDNSIVVFAENRLGIKKSQVYSMVQVGTTFLTSDGKSALTERGGRWNNTQFMALLPMAGTGKNKKSPEDVLRACEELVEQGKIKPSMTVAEIKEVVRAERPDAKRLAANAEKRKAKADAKAKAETAKAETANAETIEEKKHDTINGTKIADISIWQLDDGSIHVCFDGAEKDFNMENISNIVGMLKQATNFKK